MIKCDKCESTSVEISLDSRGVAHGKCLDCGASRVLSSKELAEHIKDLTVKEEQPEDKPICKHCFERYEKVMGNRGTREIRVPLDNEYCPFCGRKLTPEERERYHSRR